MWRPDGWDNQYPDPCVSCDHNTKYQTWDIRQGGRCERCTRDEVYDIFEAGADAMYQPAYDKGKADLLEALKKKGLANEKGVRGYLVFIPEEE